MIIGVTLSVLLWYGLVQWTPFKSFNRLPDPLSVIIEWFSTDPDYGLSIFTKDYYLHILYSTYRATVAFLLALILGVPLGIMMGWRANFNAYAGALLDFLRPIPPLAWVPIAILILPGDEPAVIYVTFLVAFFATTLNTAEVRSIDPDFYRAAECLGATDQDVLRDIIIQGSANYFHWITDCDGGRLVLACCRRNDRRQYGLGFMILESYNLVQYPTIIIMMATLGIVGYASSALIRVVGKRMIRWREQATGIGQEAET